MSKLASEKTYRYQTYIFSNRIFIYFILTNVWLTSIIDHILWQPRYNKIAATKVEFKKDVSDMFSTHNSLSARSTGNCSQMNINFHLNTIQLYWLLFLILVYGKCSWVQSNSLYFWKVIHTGFKTAQSFTLSFQNVAISLYME